MAGRHRRRAPGPLIGPVARAAGVGIDCRRDHPYAAYDRVDFDVITAPDGDVWSRLVVRAREVFESIKIIRQCLDKMESGPIQSVLKDELPAGRMGMSSVEAPRGRAIISSSPARTTIRAAGGCAPPPIRTCRPCR